MNILCKWLIGSDQQLQKRNMIWNMIGSAVYAFTSMLLGAAVTRILGAGPGGIFFFAFSTFGQQMFIVAYFGMRPIQVTDVDYKYSFHQYYSLRVFTCISAVIMGLFYVLFFAEGMEKKLVVLLMVLYKVVDGFADVYESEFQRIGRLYLTGKSNTFRTFLSIGIFLGSLIVTKNLVIASVMAVAAQAVGVFLFDQMVLRALTGKKAELESSRIKELFHSAKWLFVGSFLDLYIFAAAKYAINDYMEPSASTYFGTIFIPTSMINLAAGFIIRPFLTVMSAYWEEKQDKKLFAIMRKILYVICAFTLAGSVLAWIMGIPVLAVLLGKEAGSALYEYKLALIINIIGGGFYAALNLLYYILVIMQEQKSIFLIYVIGTVAAAIISPMFVKTAGINGGAAAYLCMMVMLTVLFAAAVFRKKLLFSNKV